jgi:DNA-binding CsgD family transcriptional regulator
MTLSMNRSTDGRPGSGTVRLSDRESEVLDLVVSGMTNAAAARRLGISERTVREHIARIFLKLRVNSRVEAAVIATEWRLARQHGVDLPQRLAVR